MTCIVCTAQVGLHEQYGGVKPDVARDAHAAAIHDTVSGMTVIFLLLTIQKKHITMWLLARCTCVICESFVKLDTDFTLNNLCPPRQPPSAVSVGPGGPVHEPFRPPQISAENLQQLLQQGLSRSKHQHSHTNSHTQPPAPGEEPTAVMVTLFSQSAFLTHPACYFLTQLVTSAHSCITRVLPRGDHGGGDRCLSADCSSSDSWPRAVPLPTGR
jgi:hypothetical protein